MIKHIIGSFITAIRRWIAKQLVSLAWKIHTESQEVKEFRREMMMEMAIKGSAIIKINPDQMYVPKD